MKTRRFRSYAKINLGLEVVGRLEGGYHELKTLFATISLHDIIDITVTRSGVSVECDHPSVPGGETNLAHRAAVLMQRGAGGKSGVAIHIKKRIPVGGGLGGGSSNAATVLRALDHMWNLGLGTAGLIDTAKSLGADVPYFLFGGPALGLGRGDEIHPLDLRLDEKLLLVPGSGGVSTAAVFRRFAAKSQPSGQRSKIDAFLRSAGGETRKEPAPTLGTLRNDLEAAALAESPELATVARRIRKTGRSTGAVHTLMSGSGSSFFLLFTDTASRARAAQDLGASGIRSLRGSFVSHRVYESRFEVRGPRVPGRS